jgi:hypothetical protein
VLDIEHSDSVQEFQGQGTETGSTNQAPAQDFVTVLTSKGPLLTKRWTCKNKKSTCIPYDRAATFDVKMVPVAGLAELAGVLDKLTEFQAVIHGALQPELGKCARDIPRRLYPRGDDEPATITEATHFWVLLDVDGIPCPEGLDPVTEPERAAAHVISLLPEEFHDAAHWWQLTGSAGFKPGIRMRLAFWMDRKLTGRDVKMWVSKVKGLDLSIYTANQLIYAARPIFELVDDPVPQRSGMCDGAVVCTPDKRPALDNKMLDEQWGRPQCGLRTYREWRAAIGDHSEGQGFFEAVKSAIGSWMRANPTEDTAWLRADLEKAIRRAPRDLGLHDDEYIEHRIRDLDRAIASIAGRERAKPPPQWIEEMNRDYAVARFGGKAVVAVTGEKEITFISKEAFFDLYANKFPPSTDEDEGTRRSKAQVWWKHRQRREYISPGVVFEPSATPKEGPGALNLWRGFAVEPKQGDWSLMRDHILNVLANGNGQHAKYILDWMAYCVQHPEVQAEVALAFNGEQGSGKGIVWRYFGNLFKPHFQHFSDPDQFTGKFNAELGKAVFVFLDEAIWGGNKSVGGKIKAMITEPTLQIEPKGIDRIQVPNRLSIVACSNESWAVPVETGDRRWAVFKTNDQYAPRICTDPATREGYFGPLHEQMENGGQAAMLYDLLRRKVTPADIRNMPNTEEKARLKSLSLKTTPAWIENILQQGLVWDEHTWTEEGLVIDKSTLFASYQDFCTTYSRRPDPPHVWGKELKAILGDAVEPEYRQRVDGKVGARKFKFAPLQTCRECFDRHVGNQLNGSHWTPPRAASEEAARPSHLRVVQPETKDSEPEAVIRAVPG